MASALQDAEQSLNLCQKSLSDLQAMQQYNQGVVDYNNNINTQYAAALAAWNQQKTQVDQNNNNATANYNSCRYNTNNNLYNDTHVWNNCILWNNVGGHDDWCSNDLGGSWNEIGSGQYGCALGQGKGLCRRTQDQINMIVNQQCPQPNYQSYPQQPIEGALKSQNTTPVQINCCTNISTVVGSNVSGTSIDQANNCINQLGSTINNIKSQPTPTPTPTPNPSLFSSLFSSNGKSTQSTNPYLFTSLLSSNGKSNINLIIIIISIICSLCVLSIIMSISINSSGNKKLKVNKSSKQLDSVTPVTNTQKSV